MHTVKQRALSLSAAAALALTLAACGSNTAQAGSESSGGEEQDLVLSQDQVTLDGQVLSEGEDGAVTLSHDIVYYQEGQGSDYGEGTAQEEHSADEADAHLVVTIREAGTYRVSGELTQGQLAVDLGEDAQDDPTAVVTVILDGVDVTCTVAPAFMVYNVYECGSTDVETSSPTVDTAAAGINVVLADGSENTFTGSHVARIYEEGTTDKLHKYDGAFYSKMSMNIGGESEGTGVLNIDGDNEGLDSELHLTINGGVINIRAQNDGINTNEDGVSVTTINGGTLQINAGLGPRGTASTPTAIWSSTAATSTPRPTSAAATAAWTPTGTSSSTAAMWWPWAPGTTRCRRSPSRSSWSSPSPPPCPPAVRSSWPTRRGTHSSPSPRRRRPSPSPSPPPT